MGDLQSLQDRLKFVALDMDALDRSCSAETAVSFVATGSPVKPAKKEQTSLPASLEKPIMKRPTSPLALDAASRLRASRKHTDRCTAWRKNSGPQRGGQDIAATTH